MPIPPHEDAHDNEFRDGSYQTAATTDEPNLRGFKKSFGGLRLAAIVDDSARQMSARFSMVGTGARVTNICGKVSNKTSKTPYNISNLNCEFVLWGSSVCEICSAICQLLKAIAAVELRISKTANISQTGRGTRMVTRDIGSVLISSGMVASSALT